MNTPCQHLRSGPLAEPRPCTAGGAERTPNSRACEALRTANQDGKPFLARSARVMIHSAQPRTSICFARALRAAGPCLELEAAIVEPTRARSASAMPITKTVSQEPSAAATPTAAPPPATKPAPKSLESGHGRSFLRISVTKWLEVRITPVGAHSYCDHTYSHCHDSRSKGRCCG